MSEKLTYSVEEACEAIGIGRSMLYRLIAQEKIRSVRVGRRTLIPVQAVHDFLGVEPLKGPPDSSTSVNKGTRFLVTVTPLGPDAAALIHGAVT